MLHKITHKCRIVILVQIGLACLPLRDALFAGSLTIEFEAHTVHSFDARGMTYSDIYKVVASFCGVDGSLAAAPPGPMQLTAKDKTWPEIMLMLHDERTFRVVRNSDGKLVVTRAPRQ